jgi:Mrr N-terminal domain
MATEAQYTRFVSPILESLRDLGGTGSSGEVIDLASRKLGLSDAERSERTEGGSLRIDDQVRQACQFLVREGLLDGSVRGTWKLTDKGWVFAPRAGRTEEAPSRKKFWRGLSRWWFLSVGLVGVALFVLQLLQPVTNPWLLLASAVVTFGSLTTFAWKTMGLAATLVMILLWYNNVFWLVGAAIVLVFQGMNQPNELPFSLYHVPVKASCTSSPVGWLFRGFEPGQCDRLALTRLGTAAVCGLIGLVMLVIARDLWYHNRDLRQMQRP